MDNPFTHSRVVTGESFCNRQQELKDLTYYAQNNQTVLLWIPVTLRIQFRLDFLQGVILLEQTGYRHQKQGLPNPIRHAQKLDFKNFAGIDGLDKIGIFHLLSDQAMCLWFIKKPPKYGRFSVLGCTFQGQKHGCKDFGVL